MSKASDPSDSSDDKPSTPVPPRGGKKGRPSGPGGAKGRPAPAPARKGGPPAKGSRNRQAARRRNQTLAIASVVVVVVVIAVVVILGVSSSSNNGIVRKPAPQTAVGTITGVPVSTLTAASKQFSGLNPATPAASGSAALTSGGKPEILYIGAEFCPICGAERWPMTIALSKFGTFTNLQQTHSAVADGNIGTWSYYGANYTSQYIDFKHFELYTNQPSAGYYKALEKLPSAEQSLWSANLGSNLSFPFIDFGGKFYLSTAQFDPGLIEQKTFESTLGLVGDNTNTVGADIDASAAVFTKYICSLTNDQPSNVCSAVSSVPLLVSSSGTNGGSSSVPTTTPAG